jgi:hypothetical protein
MKKLKMARSLRKKITRYYQQGNIKDDIKFTFSFPQKYPVSRPFAIPIYITLELGAKDSEVPKDKKINITNIQKYRRFNINKYINEIMLAS